MVNPIEPKTNVLLSTSIQAVNYKWYIYEITAYLTMSIT